MNGRWFEKTGLSVPKEDSSEIVKKKVIERGSVVSIEGYVGVFLFFVVWRKDSPVNPKVDIPPLYKWIQPILACFGESIEFIQDRCRDIVFGYNDKLVYM